MRRDWLPRLETGLIVTVISVLVWLYAEGENVQLHPNQRLLVEFVAPAGQSLAIDPQDPVEILVSFRASAGEMGLLEEKLRAGPIQIPVGNGTESESNEQTVVLKDALDRSAIGSLGINITDTDPVTETVRAEPLVTRRLPIAEAPTRVQFGTPPKFEPAQVAVTLPRSLAEAAENAKVLARLDTLNLNEYEANTDVTASVPLELPAPLRSPWTTLGAATAQVTFNIRKLSDSIVLPTVPLRVSADPLLLQEFDVLVAQDGMMLRDVRLSGPSDVIEAIRKNEVRIWAELRPTREQVERGDTSLTPVLVTPPGIAFEPPEPVAVTVQRR